MLQRSTKQESDSYRKQGLKLFMNECNVPHHTDKLVLLQASGLIPVLVLF